MYLARDKSPARTRVWSRGRDRHARQLARSFNHLRRADAMSAVDNVDARISRLQRSLDEKRAELRAYHTRQRYNPTLGVDEAIASGQSVASLDVRVVGGRNMLFSSGFLAGTAPFCCLGPEELLQRRLTTFVDTRWRRQDDVRARVARAARRCSEQRQAMHSEAEHPVQPVVR